MKIIRIIGDELFAFHFDNEAENELARLLNQWNDISFIYRFIKRHKEDAPKNTSTRELINLIIENAQDIDNILYEISKDQNRRLEEFFKPLDNLEYRIVELSKQKGRRKYLRIYAIRIDENCFVITGGAIKFHHLNNDRLHTKTEMVKLEYCRDYLKINGVHDADSFYELINEEDEQQK